MKILKHKNLMGIILSVLLAMPILSIAVRSAYVACNKNAYQSYSGINEEQYNDVSITNFNELQIGATYIFNSSNSQTINASNTKRIYFDNLNIISCTSSSFQSIFENCNSFTTTWYNYAYLVPYDDVTSYNALDMNAQSITFTFRITNEKHTNDTYTNQWDNFISKRIYNDYATLDNVFEYSVSKFTEENNLGNINLFGWFTDIFLNDNATNNLYVGFANWYLNYAMLVSCMHLIFLILMWFINFARRLLERGMNYDF